MIKLNISFIDTTFNMQVTLSRQRDRGKKDEIFVKQILHSSITLKNHRNGRSNIHGAICFSKFLDLKRTAFKEFFECHFFSTTHEGIMQIYYEYLRLFKTLENDHMVLIICIILSDIYVISLLLIWKSTSF